MILILMAISLNLSVLAIILKKLPITFPNTTNCKIPSTGGEIIEN